MKFSHRLIICSLAILSCSCAFVPINNQYEKAGTLKKGGIELSGNATANSASGGGETENINNNFGFRVGYGISDRFDLKLRYERLIPSSSDKDFKGANYFSLVPKIALIPEKFSFLIPISHYSYKEVFFEDDGEEKGAFSSIAPQVIYTFTNPKKTTDLSLGLKADFLFGGGGGGVIMGATVGAGFSSNLSKWAIRPEVGASFLGGAAFLNYGIGFQLIIPKR